MLEQNRFHNLSFIGFPNYSVDINGFCVKEPSRRQATTNSRGKYVLFVYRNGETVVKSYAPRDLVVAAWSELDEKWWKESPFAEDIRNFKINFRDLPTNEKVKLSYTDSQGNGFWLTKYGTLWRGKDLTEASYPTNNTGYVNLKIGTKENVKLHRLVAH